MAALSKLRLTAKEAANLLGVSPNSVYTTRRRLRQGLGLEQDADPDPKKLVTQKTCFKSRSLSKGLASSPKSPMVRPAIHILMLQLTNQGTCYNFNISAH